MSCASFLRDQDRLLDIHSCFWKKMGFDALVISRIFEQLIFTDLLTLFCFDIVRIVITLECFFVLHRDVNMNMNIVAFHYPNSYDTIF